MTPITVKPLSWRYLGSEWHAYSAIGEYRAFERDGRLFIKLPKSLKVIQVFGTIDDAKRQCFEHYSTAIGKLIEHHG